ncbi:hypothetical protein M569_10767, partial [Genlisea aurea]
PPRRLLSPAATNNQDPDVVAPLAGGLTAGFSCFLLLILCFRRISKKRTAPSASDTASKKPPHSLSYAEIRRATGNFSPDLRLGQGGFGSVYRADLKWGGLNPSSKDSPSSRVAVKLMDSGSLQGEREFQNELLFSSKIDSRYVVSVLGFSSNPRKRRMLLVYELMENGSLQDCLFHRRSEELRNWDRRFSIALNIAKGLEYLHHYCDPPIIHGDIKPSNVLLDGDFVAKIGDFGLARFKSEVNVAILEADKKKDCSVEDNASALDDAESVITTSGFDDANHHVRRSSCGVERSPESVEIYASPGVDLSPVLSPTAAAAIAASPSESGGESSASKNKKMKKKSITGRDWWWKQDNEPGRVKDYVMEWIGSEVGRERPKGELIGAASTEKSRKKKRGEQPEWWASLDDEKVTTKKKDKRRPAREWWKEEYCEELQRKKRKKKKNTKKKLDQDDSWPIDDDDDDDDVDDDDGFYSDKKKKKKKKRSSSIDLWRRARKNSYDSISGEIPRSGGISSTPSMRGTVCYIAPEYGGGGGDDVSEKCDVYSYGVVLLVLISGRRPLQVTGSPMSEFQRANLVSWARSLARAGKLSELVDRRILDSANKEEQALLCITVALLCLQKTPASRPPMKEVVRMLSGDVVSPQLPVEFSPSPPCRIPFKGRKKV